MEKETETKMEAEIELEMETETETEIEMETKTETEMEMEMETELETETERLCCPFLQESSGFLFFLLLWHFFHRNHDSCSAVTFSERPQETCLYGAYVGSYVGNEFGRHKT